MARVDGMARGPRRRWRKNVRLKNRDGSEFTRPTTWPATSYFDYPLASGSAFAPAGATGTEGILSTAKLKAWYDASQTTGQTLATDDFTRTAVGPVSKVRDTFTRTAVVTDDFSEADGTSLSGKATDTGQTWFLSAGSGSVIGGKANLSTGGVSLFDVQVGLSDVAVSAVFSLGSVVSIGPAVRVSDALNLIFAVMQSGFATKLQKRVAGAYTVLASGASVTASSTSTPTLTCIGSSVSFVYSGGTLAVTEAFNATATRAGLWSGFDVADVGSLIDNFSVTRADLGTAETGDTWIETLGEWGIDADGKARVFTSVTSGQAVVDVGTGDVDLTVTTGGTVSASSLIGLTFRQSDSANWWRWGSDNVNQYLQKSVAGVLTQFYNAGSAPVAGDVYRAICIGSLIQILKNGVVVHTLTDSFNATATRHGLHNQASLPTTLDTFSISTPATGVTDDFSEADGTVLNGKVTDTGQVWNVSGTWTVTAGKVGSNGGSATVETGLADVNVQADLVWVDQCGLTGRYTDENNLILVQKTSTTAYSVLKKVAGAFTSLASGSASASTTPTLALRMIGSSLSIVVDSVVVASATDAFNATVTKHGLRNEGSNAANRWDNFSVTRADLGFATGLNGTKIPWVEVSGDWGIDANGRAYLVTTGLTQHFATIDTKTGDVDLSVVLAVKGTAGGGGENPRLSARVQDSSNFYSLTDNVNWQLYKTVAGAQTQLGVNGPVVANGDVARLVVVGSQITAYVNGVQFASVTDTALANTITKHGLQNYNSTTARFDTFSVATPTLAANDPISVLPDLSGNGNHAVQATAANQPKFGFGTITDDFNQADGVLGTSVTGQTWVTPSAANDPQVFSNQVGNIAAATRNAYVETGMPDASVEVSVPVLATGGSNGGALLRWSDDLNYLRVVIGGTTDNNFYLAKIVAGVQTILVTSPARAAADTLKATMKGSSYTLFRNGVQVGSATDAFNSTATKHGVNLSDNAIRLDNFSVTSLAGGKAVGVFDGGTDFLRTANALNTNPLTLFAVVRSSDALADDYILDLGVSGADALISGFVNNVFELFLGGGGRAQIGSNSDLNAHILDVVWPSTGAPITTFRDGTAGATLTAPAHLAAILTIGGTGASNTTEPFLGDIAAVLVYEGALSYTDRRTVETYLAARYGITLTA